MSTVLPWNTNAIPAATTATQTERVQLPEIVDAEGFLSEPLETPAELVNGLIHRNTLTIFSGGSKTFKTFLQMDLALSVSQGLDWWGRQVVQGRVLYVNFEIAPAFFQKRLADLADVKSLERPIKDFDVWNLRGFSADASNLIPRITEQCKDKDYSIIILDPIYKLMGGRSENAANEMAEFLNYFETLSNETGSAVVYNHHFAKGVASNKDHIDRASGSGVFARHADGIITLTAHEEENAFTFEATLRNFPPVKPFVLRWEHPLMYPDYKADPAKLKNKPGAKSKYTVDQVVCCLDDEMTTGEWEKAAYVKLGLAHSTFANLKNQAVRLGLVELRGSKWFWPPQTASPHPVADKGRVRKDDAPLLVSLPPPTPVSCSPHPF